MDYDKIQPRVKNDINDAIKKYASDSKFNVAQIPAHTHTGVDSNQVNFSDLVDAQTYIGIQRTTLTSTQVLALFTTPITIVSSIKGALILVTSIDVFIKFNTIAYTGANNLEFRYKDASGAKVTADIANTFINSASTAYAHVAGVTTALTPVINTPIVVTVPTANPATGNSPMTVIVKYYISSFF